MRSKLADVQERLVDWLVTPSRDREPSTRQLFAETLGVSVATFRRYEYSVEVEKEVQRRLQKMNVNPERVQRLVDQMYENAFNEDLKGSERAAFMKMYLQYVGQLMPANRHPRNAEPSVEDMSDEDVMAEVVSLRAVEG